MVKLKNTKPHQSIRTISVLAVVAVFALGITIPQMVRADEFETKIRSLTAQNQNNQSKQNQLSIEAESLEAVIAKLQERISALEAQIRSNHEKSRLLQIEIVAAEEELDRQRELLGQSIRAMYMEGDISTFEMLASSKNLSEFIDKQQYHNSVKSKIKDTLDKVNALKQELDKQRNSLELLIQEQEGMQEQLALQRGEQTRLLNLNTAQRNALDKEIRSNNTKIAELRREQAIANARFIGVPGSGVNCGGGYPGSSAGPWGRWGCSYPLDHNVDSWGMFNRQCVSYTAFKVAASGRNMPKWGLMHPANATQWPGLARQYNIPVSNTPQVGSVAISHAGHYGHAMYVDHVYGDGTIYISQYNAGWDGRYSEARISAAGLEYIHFR